MNPFAQHLIFAAPYIELWAFDVDFDMPAASPYDIDAQLQLLLLSADADPAPATSLLDAANNLIVDPAILSHTVLVGATALPGSHDLSPEPGAPVLPMPLAPQSDALDAPPTSIALDDSQLHTSAAPAPAPASLLRVPSTQALSLPLSPPGSSTGGRTHRKTRAQPYALQCPRCSFVQENGRKWDLDRHIKTHEPIRDKFVCRRRGCEESFSRMDALRRHQKNPKARCALPQGDDV
ncbi:hypothetical protein FA95DRAFT_1346655 [Auriscalpium vulgare]|uniref:Uncharacterized protein n=1 Tax=Auriscalpium vulgare TaxID=40419 RepID=A0ACB8RRA8_9AGAM|nr:hypothetical protein FA95DRAFT_1346655 [Auriscalpium vulgare]